MSNIKLRHLSTAEGLTPAELELINYNYWIIENALNSVGAVSPIISPPGPPSILPFRHDQLQELGDDDHLQYLLLAGRGTQNIIGPLTLDSINVLKESRQVNTTAPLAGGGDLSVNRTLSINDATTSAKGAVELATDGENAANVVVQGNDARLSDARTPTTHKATHIAGGSDIIESFPVGSVFIAVVSTNPNTLLGYGTWAAFGAGRVLIGLDSGDTDFDSIEETGGAKTVASAGTIGANDVAIVAEVGATGAARDGHLHPYTGSPTSVVQPYIVVHMWKRTA
jgi:hypothetical protein